MIFNLNVSCRKLLCCSEVWSFIQRFGRCSKLQLRWICLWNVRGFFIPWVYEVRNVSFPLSWICLSCTCCGHGELRCLCCCCFIHPVISLCNRWTKQTLIINKSFISLSLLLICWRICNEKFFSDLVNGSDSFSICVHDAAAVSVNILRHVWIFLQSIPFSKSFGDWPSKET